ncbi:GlsB/YeaQ/YmgE family stress response membrane protein [Sphingorhabdus sp. Alg239-R122]|uniref:GlsB/YeaQ/YmgE family stress response membrane protein n=1 Tax=Sphingorhabdus sp. Alg239-R122 TaxID=2305989 RepID=UPI0013DD36BE|nr:GlsB/YeaQ/YmgE family stress response membrane protein [Sphingorhabdus sp. Alg239-R122]
MGWIATIIIGGIAGWLASMVMGRDASMGILLNIVVGVVGGIIGSFIGTQMGFLAPGGAWLSYLITAFIGAIILLLVANLIQRGRVR